MLDINVNEIEKIAKEEIQKEDFRKEVDKMKIKLKQKKTWRQILFPWKIKIERI